MVLEATYIDSGPLRTTSYLSVRALTGVQRVSLHGSGKWRSAFTENHVAKGSPFVPPGKDRAFDKWNRPPEFAPGRTLAFKIFVPASEVTMPPYPEASATLRGTDIVWVPAAPGGCATAFTVLFTSAEVTTAIRPGWPGQNGMGTRLIFMAPLPNKECVWLVAYEQPIPQEQKQMIEEYKHGLITDLRHHMGEDAYSQIPEPRGYLYGHNEQAQWRYFIDFSAANVEA